METILIEPEKEKKTEVEFEDVDLSFSCQPEKKIKLDTSYYGDMSVIILQVKNAKFENVLKPYDIDICGKKMWEWVALACDGYPTKSIVCADDVNVVAFVKPFLSNTKFTAVFFSDTPLLQKENIEEIFMFARSHDINVLKLTRGFVFNTEYLKGINEISSPQTQFFNEEEFYTCLDFSHIAFVRDVIKSRIINFHMQNGIEIVDPLTTFIDCDVTIENNVKIMPNNFLRGITFVGKNCLIESGNIVENSIISDNCKLIQSFICESRISENTTVGPFEKIYQQSI